MLTFVVSHKVHILRRNIDQIKGIISATFGSSIWEAVLETDDCKGPKTDAEELACDYNKMMAEDGSQAARHDHNSSLVLFSKVCRTGCGTTVSVC